MRTSFNMLSTNYLKKNEEEEETNIINNNDNNTTKTDNMQQQPTQQAPRDRKQYLNYLTFEKLYNKVRDIENHDIKYKFITICDFLKDKNHFWYCCL